MVHYTMPSTIVEYPTNDIIDCMYGIKPFECGKVVVDFDARFFRGACKKRPVGGDREAGGVLTRCRGSGSSDLRLQPT